jgi:hypothetical protein
MKPEFFLRLYEDQAFCAGLGRVVLAAGRLESMLREYLSMKRIAITEKEATLGRITSIMKTRNLLTRNGEIHFSQLTLQRNYLTHSLFDLFAEKIEESLLPRSNVTEMDVDLFAERAAELANDLDHFGTFVHQAIANGGSLKDGLFSASGANET